MLEAGLDDDVLAGDTERDGTESNEPGDVGGREEDTGAAERRWGGRREREREEGRRSRGRFSPLSQTKAIFLLRSRTRTRHVQGNGVVLDEADVEPVRSVEDDVGT